MFVANVSLHGVRKQELAVTLRHLRLGDDSM